MKSFSNTFGFICNIFCLSDSELRKSCEELDQYLKDDSRNESDIDPDDLFQEIRSLKVNFKNSFTTTDQIDPHSILTFLFENDLLSTFPIVSVAVRIFLTLSVSVASGRGHFLNCN